jgi:hypothetical protein
LVTICISEKKRGLKFMSFIAESATLAFRIGNDDIIGLERYLKVLISSSIWNRNGAVKWLVKEHSRFACPSSTAGFAISPCP